MEITFDWDVTKSVPRCGYCSEQGSTAAWHTNTPKIPIAANICLVTPFILHRLRKYFDAMFSQLYFRTFCNQWRLHLQPLQHPRQNIAVYEVRNMMQNISNISSKRNARMCLLCVCQLFPNPSATTSALPKGNGENQLIHGMLGWNEHCSLT